MLNKREESNNFVGRLIRSIVTLRGPPLNNLLGLEEAFINQGENGGFGTLNCSPFIPSGLGCLALFAFPLVGCLLGCYPECHDSRVASCAYARGCQKHAKKARYWSRGVPRRFNRDEEEGKARADLKRGGGNKNSKRIG